MGSTAAKPSLQATFRLSSALLGLQSDNPPTTILPEELIDDDIHWVTQERHLSSGLAAISISGVGIV